MYVATRSTNVLLLYHSYYPHSHILALQKPRKAGIANSSKTRYLQTIFSWHSCSFFRYIYIRYSFKREGYEKFMSMYIMLMHRFVRKELQKFADKSWKNSLTLQQILGFLRDCPPHVLFLRWFQYLVPGRRLRYGRDWSPSTHPYTPYSTVSSEVVTRLKMKPCPGWEAV